MTYVILCYAMLCYGKAGKIIAKLKSQ